MNSLKSLLGPESPLASFLGIQGIKRLAIGLAIGIGVLAAFKLLRILLGLFLKHRIPAKVAGMAEKAIRYLGMGIAVLIVLDVAGVDVRALLGAAGIAGIALGFAAQTSIANVISGLFLLGEKSFSVGDVIRSGDALGTVTSIDLLSIKLTTFDNQLLRLPNESLIKNVLVNMTRFPIRRLNVELTAGRGQDLIALRDVLKQAAAGVKEVLLEPEPIYLVESFEEDGVRVLFGVWIRQEDFAKAKNAMFVSIQRAYTSQGIAAPFKRIEMADASPGPEAKRQASKKR